MIDLDKLIYIGAFLTDESKEALKKIGVTYINKLHDSGVDISLDKCKLYCDHMTLMFHTEPNKDIINWTAQHLNEMVKVYAYEIGYSDKAVAVKLETDVPSANKLKHITVAINLKNHGSPVDSNQITKWIPLCDKNRNRVKYELNAQIRLFSK